MRCITLTTNVAESGKSNSNKGGKPTIPVVHSASMLENARDTVFKEVSFNNVNGDMSKLALVYANGDQLSR